MLLGAQRSLRSPLSTVSHTPTILYLLFPVLIDPCIRCTMGFGSTVRCSLHMMRLCSSPTDSPMTTAPSLEDIENPVLLCILRLRRCRFRNGTDFARA